VPNLDVEGVATVKQTARHAETEYQLSENREFVNVDNGYFNTVTY